MEQNGAEYAIKLYQQMADARSNWESLWSRTARYAQPHEDKFSSTKTPGTEHHSHIYDETMMMAVPRFCAAVESLVTPRSQKWHGLSVDDATYDEKVYLERVTDILFQKRYAARANYAGNVYKLYESCALYGTGCMFVDEDLRSGGFVYRAIPLWQLYIKENYVGRVDTVVRKFSYTVRQAVQHFGMTALDDAADKLRNCPEKEIEFLHVVAPNEDARVGMLDGDNMAFRSLYVNLSEKRVVKRSGYTTMPYIVVRYMPYMDAPYGRSPASFVLPATRSLQQMGKSITRGIAKQVDPVMLVPEDGILRQFDNNPGAINYGGIDMSGNQIVREMRSEARFDWAKDYVNERRSVVNDAFLVTLFQILVDTPRMTATEVLERAKEKGALLAPTMGQFQAELGDNQITRELDLAARARWLPEMPRSLMERGGIVKVEYTSELNRLMRAQDAVGLQRTLETLVPLASIDPTALDPINLREAAIILADVHGAPTRSLRRREEIEEMDAQRAEAAQQEKIMQGAPMMAAAMRDVATAQATQANTQQQAVA